MKPSKFLYFPLSSFRLLYIPLIFVLIFNQTLTPIAMAQSENATPSALINQIPEATSSATFTPNVVGPTIIPTLMQPDQTVS